MYIISLLFLLFHLFRIYDKVTCKS